MKCFNGKIHSDKYLKELFNTDMGWNTEASVKWCPICGAIVVDKESDNRRFGQYVKMKFPEITRKAVK
jgi:hypothetical protein